MPSTPRFGLRSRHLSGAFSFGLADRTRDRTTRGALDVAGAIDRFCLLVVRGLVRSDRLALRHGHPMSFEWMRGARVAWSAGSLRIWVRRRCAGVVVMDFLHRAVARPGFAHRLAS